MTSLNSLLLYQADGVFGVIDSNVLVALIAAIATVATAIIALRKDRDASPPSVTPPNGSSDQGIVTVLITRVGELEKRDTQHDIIEAALWSYVRDLQFWGSTTTDQVPRHIPKPPEILTENRQLSEENR